MRRVPGPHLSLKGEVASAAAGEGLFDHRGRSAVCGLRPEKTIPRMRATSFCSCRGPRTADLLLPLPQPIQQHRQPLRLCLKGGEVRELLRRVRITAKQT
jgi:hypothetical protein